MSLPALPQEYAGPGLVDLQVNGYAGLDFTGAPERWTGGAFHAARREMSQRGVGIAIPTFITGPAAGLLAQAARYREIVGQDADLARFYPKIHVEGPFISPETGPRGAHPLEHCRTPLEEPDLLDHLMEASGGRIGLITLAPELPGALETIERWASAGVAVGIGHTNANRDQIQAAVAAGASLSTHLGNGSHAMLPRMDNYIQAQLAEDRLQATFIADGHHVPFHVLRNFLRAKGVERSMLVTDAIAAAGLGPGEYTLGGARVVVSSALRATMAGHDGLAGSALTLDVGVINAFRHGGVTFEEAWTMASTRPAALLGLEAPAPVIVAVRPEGFQRT